MVRRSRGERAVGRPDPPPPRRRRDGGLHAGQPHRPAAGDARQLRPTPRRDPRRSRGSSRTDRVARVGNPGAGRHRRRTGPQPGARAARDDSRHALAERPEGRLRHAGAVDPGASHRAGRLPRPGKLLPGRRPLSAGEPAEYRGRRAGLRGLARWRAARYRPAPLDSRRTAAGRGRVDRPPRRRAADGLRDAARGGHRFVDAVAGGHLVVEGLVPDG